MNIFVAFNDGYALPTKVMLKSLILNNPGPLVIYVFYSSLEQRSIDSVRELEDGESVFFRFRKVEDSFLDGIAIPPQFSKETYYRLLAHHLFNEDIEKVLWLDGDLIINGPLSDFYEQDFHGKLYIAVEDFNSRFLHAKRVALKMPPDAAYINSGVMLFNLKDAQKTLNDEEIVQYLADNQDVLEYADQDVFNGLLHEHILIVDPEHRYNYFAEYITIKNRKSVCQNARVIHFCGERKPWKKDFYNPGFSLWWKYAWKTGPEYRARYLGLLLSHLRARPKKNIDFRNTWLDPKYVIWRFKLFSKRILPGPYFFLKRLYDRAAGKQSKEESLHDIFSRKTKRRVDP
ncbi:MAG: glycosyltransferase family 8 protein [Oscillospiraceae bacterium]|nr:glycosyltransferase family 8 protein [Oscillospiraceae bacterium]